MHCAAENRFDDFAMPLSGISFKRKFTIITTAFVQLFVCMNCIILYNIVLFAMGWTNANVRFAGILVFDGCNLVFPALVLIGFYCILPPFLFACVGVKNLWINK